MAQEIELKFIVAQDGVETLREQLNALEAKHTPAGQLLNIYYETADNWLRRHDMGLRIGGAQGRSGGGRPAPAPGIQYSPG